MEQLPKIKYVQVKKVSCEGENPEIGHPKIFLNMDEKNDIICPYCSLKFIYKK
jgi:uncharacterized Zn-finger protein